MLAAKEGAVTVDQNFKINPRIIFENIDGEVIMIHLDVGQYFSLHGLAAQLWGFIEKSVSTQKMIEIVTGYYQEDVQKIDHAVRKFLKELESASLIVPIIQKKELLLDTNHAIKLVDLPNAFTQPQLQQYTDMEELLLIDPVHEVDDEGWPHRPLATETEQ